jgi:hypothetical protein
MDTRASRRSRVLDHLLNAFALRPRRCRVCRKRFYTRDHPELSMEPAKVIRAERVELINKQGKALAVLEVEYSEAAPAGAPRLTFTDTGEMFRQGRKLVLGPGEGLTFHDCVAVPGGWSFSEGR